MQTIALAFPLIYPVFIIGLCGYLLSRGVTHLFVILFAVGAVLHALPTLGIVLLQQAPGGFSANMRWIGALSIFGMLGTLVSGAAFLLLADFLLRSQQSEV